jgi:hypothetical protein
LLLLLLLPLHLLCCQTSFNQLPLLMLLALMHRLKILKQHPHCWQDNRGTKLLQPLLLNTHKALRLPLLLLPPVLCPTNLIIDLALSAPTLPCTTQLPCRASSSDCSGG